MFGGGGGGGVLSGQKFLQCVDDHLVILMLLEATHDHDADDTLDAADAHGHAAAVDGILTRAVAEHVLLAKGLLVAVHLVVHEPRADAPAEHGLALPRHPQVVVRLHAGARHGVEEQVVGIREGDVDHRRQRRQVAQPLPDRQADLERVVRREVRQDQGFFLFGNLGELLRRETGETIRCLPSILLRLLAIHVWTEKERGGRECAWSMLLKAAYISGRVAQRLRSHGLFPFSQIQC